MTMKYDFNSIEQRWQQHWAENKTFAAPNPGDDHFDPEKPKYYVLDMFPYPSGVGLHVGHPLGYIATDIVARYKRMTGYQVIHPMGYDAFGLPAEQYAVETGVHPRITTEKNIENMTRQLKQLGLSYDWDRCVATTDEDYYKWTQWIFLQLFNSWFDPAANKARPIAELINKLESGEMNVDINGEVIAVAASGAMDTLGGTAVGARKWYELTEEEQRSVLDNMRLAFLDEVPVNWCPALGTVLANEEVTNDGKSERGNHPVFKRPLKQWMLRITAFADRLEQELELVDWPEPIKLMQRNWIGRSEGASVDFSIDGGEDTIAVFTTRPDTLFGATYMVLAPEHPLVEQVTTHDHADAVREYQQQAAQRSDVDRLADAKTKTGVFTGAFAVNPVNEQKIPIWIADYVMMGYGTGAIMAVPAHDQRDFDFAQTFDLPIIPVVSPDDTWLKEHKITRDSYMADGGAASLDDAFTGAGCSINSANSEVSLDNLATPEAKSTITKWLNDKGLGYAKVQYKLRDWLFSRQRYWGEPFPILHGPKGEIRGVDEADLPVTLPEMEDFKPTASDDPDAPPQPPLGRAGDDWKVVEIDGVKYTRELNTMPQWAGSCWYYLRFLDSKNSDRFASKEAEQYWMTASNTPGTPKQGGIDLYVGGAEHAVLHLLYSRFWHKVLFDLGHVTTPEPFGRLFNQGYIQAFAYTDARGVYVPAEDVVESDGQFSYNGEPVTQEFGKMGKSLKNAIAPDDVCNEFGCDTLRLYEMYLGPLDQSKVWRTHDIVGVHRFLQRLWRNFVEDETGIFLVTDDAPTEKVAKLMHKTIKRVTEAMDTLSLNVAIAAMIELNNALVPLDKLPREVATNLVLMLAPTAPHIAEELWNRLGNEKSLASEDWPTYDEAMLVEDMIELPVQVNGKLRGRITVAADADDQTIEEIAKRDENVAASIGDATVRKVIIIKGRMVNIVAK